MQNDSRSLPYVDVDSLVHPKEAIYFTICIFVAIVLYAVLVLLILSGTSAGVTVLFYTVLGVVGYFAGSAYSRACEYTCDRVGNALEPDGSIDGLLVLAAGRDLYNQVDAAEYANQRSTERGFFVRFAEIVSTHPNLTKRVAVLGTSRPRHGVGVGPGAPTPQLPETVAAGGL